MAVKSTRLVDDQGRIIIPKHIRKALNLAPGNVVEVDLNEDGSIKLRPTEERCSLCGTSVQGKHRATIKTNTENKYICFECSQKILKNITGGLKK